jgi:hypothetical protein
MLMGLVMSDYGSSFVSTRISDLCLGEVEAEADTLLGADLLCRGRVTSM